MRDARELLGEPTLIAFEPRFITQTKVFMADALAPREEAVGKLLRLEFATERYALEPLGGISCGILELEDFDAALVFVGGEDGGEICAPFPGRCLPNSTTKGAAAKLKIGMSQAHSIK